MATMTDWTADDLLTGKPVSDEESMRLSREAMDDPESVTLVVKGKNGHTLQWAVNSHERTRLVLGQRYDQEEPPEEAYYTLAHELPWAPRWKRYTWTVETHFSYRPEDFMVCPGPIP